METISSIHSRERAPSSVLKKNAPAAESSEAPGDRFTPHQPEIEAPAYSAASVRLQFQTAARLPSPPEASLQPRLDEDEAREVKRLQERDRYVRIHEGRHAAALGAYAGAVHYNYEAGPDRRLYAVGGYTEVNTMPAPTPEAAAAKARIIRNAALAPGAVSGTDFMVATSAANMERMAMDSQPA